MIHVPDVGTTVEWHTSIGFRVNAVNEEDGEANWASLSFDESELMLNAGGRTSTGHRREVDLYIRVDDVDELFDHLKNRVELVEELHNTFYGMREFIIRDPNRFWIVFGQPVRDR